MDADRRLDDPVVLGKSWVFAPAAVGFAPLFRPHWYLLRRLVCWRWGHEYVLKSSTHLVCERCECFWFALGGEFMERSEAEIIREMRSSGVKFD